MLQNRSGIDRLQVFILTRSGVCQQPFNLRFHPAGPVYDHLDQLVPFLIQFSAILALKNLGATSHRAKGFLQIMRGGIGKLLQIRIRTAQLSRTGCQSGISFG